MHRLSLWLMIGVSVLSVLVTVGITMFFACCMKCSDCSGRDKDDLFKPHNL